MKLFKRKLGSALLSTALLALLSQGNSVHAETFRFAFQGDAQSLDPYTLNETFSLGLLGNVYEGLVRRHPDGARLEPALAESWEFITPTQWRFHLRKGVKFHNGNDFNADDVLFSAERIQAENSNLKSQIPKGTKIVKVDDYTVDFFTEQPNPTLNTRWSVFYIMDKEWAEENNTTKPSSLSDGTDSYAAFHENGTGPFIIKEREKGIKTVLVPFKEWWDTPEHNLTEVIFTPVHKDQTRTAALLSGDLDLAYPLPVQDIGRIQDSKTVRTLIGPEVRTIYLGFNTSTEKLKGGQGPNPLRDIRVRKAFQKAINIPALSKVVMRGLADPTAIMIAAPLYSKASEFSPVPFDLEEAKKLIEEAGYKDGFDLSMDCPNNRYVNDEELCVAISTMLSKIGVRVNLIAQPKAQFFAKVLKPTNDTDFYLFGWQSGSYDSWSVISDLLSCFNPEKGDGEYNFGNYCNPEIGRINDQILVELDPEKRDELIKQVYQIAQEEVPTLPLHDQKLLWGVSNDWDVKQRADNVLVLNYVRKKEAVK